MDLRVKLAATSRTFIAGRGTIKSTLSFIESAYPAVPSPEPLAYYTAITNIFKTIMGWDSG
jgi:hypothetical protein